MIKKERLPDEAIFAWRTIQKQFAYPVNALGKRIDPAKKSAVAHWKRYGIDHYLDRSLVKKFEADLKRKKKKLIIFSQAVTIPAIAFLLFLLVAFSGSVRDREPRSDSVYPLYSSSYISKCQSLSRAYLTENLISPSPEKEDATGLWHYPALALVSRLTGRELILYERHQPYRRTFKNISEMTGLDGYYFAALFHAESDLRHTVLTSNGKEKLLRSPMNAIGVSQVTQIALDHLNQEIDFYREVIAKREQIRHSYAITGDLDFVEELAKGVGARFIISALAQSASATKRENIDEASDLPEKYRRDPLHLNFRGLTNSEDLCVEISRRLDILRILIGGDQVDMDLLTQDASYAIKVGAAYFYLDYMTLQAAFPQYEEAIVLEMAINSYNAGRGGILRLVDHHGDGWRKYRYKETQIHWNRFNAALNSLKTIEQKLRLPGQSENVVAND
ncbi:MAG: hypothetical protein B6244_06375 [Candidatus Cloacimonetes bacterium 4572_55]|nr:MAG: hypothetical protein B6244_06375 [Candidatus Cloacimonetes bacterium 4572_55]